MAHPGSGDEEEIDSTFSQMELLLNTHPTWADLRACLDVDAEFFNSDKVALKQLKKVCVGIDSTKFKNLTNQLAKLTSSNLHTNMVRLLKLGIGIECSFLILKHQVQFWQWTHRDEGDTAPAPNLIKDTIIPFYDNVKNKLREDTPSESEDSDLDPQDELRTLRQDQIRLARAQTYSINIPNVNQNDGDKTKYSWKPVLVKMGQFTIISEKSVLRVVMIRSIRRPGGGQWSVTLEGINDGKSIDLKRLLYCHGDIVSVGGDSTKLYEIEGIFLLNHNRISSFCHPRKKKK
eukprot:94875_1